MNANSMTPALLVLEDGTCFEGFAKGACKEVSGSVVFTTSMSGYQEAITDPANYGHIIVFTTAHLGNYGTTPLDSECPMPKQEHCAAGIVCHDLFIGAENGNFPHFRAESTFNKTLEKMGIPLLCGVDTRALTMHLRNHGAIMRGIVSTSTDREELLKKVKEFTPLEGQELVNILTTKNTFVFDADTSAMLGKKRDMTQKQLKVAVIDFGVKRSLLMHLVKNNMQPTVYPASVTAEEILAGKPDAVMLSSGAGDPATMEFALGTIKGLLGKLPVFGVGLGHQLLAMAEGAKTCKMPLGHHGGNHPVKDLKTGKVLITAQNHSYNLVAGSLPENVQITHVNLNDNTVEGIALKNAPAFSVQFYPEADAGPFKGVFEQFREMVENFYK